MVRRGLFLGIVLSGVMIAACAMAVSPYESMVSVTTDEGVIIRDASEFSDTVGVFEAVTNARGASPELKFNIDHNPAFFEKWSCSVIGSRDSMRFDVEGALRAQVTNTSTLEAFAVLPRPRMGYVVTPYRPIGGYLVAGSEIELEWNSVHDAAYYEVFVSTDKAGLANPITRVAQVSEATSATFIYQIPPVVSGDVSSGDRQFFWKIKAYDNDSRMLSESRIDYFTMEREEDASGSSARNIDAVKEAAAKYLEGRGIDPDKIDKYSVQRIDEFISTAKYGVDNDKTCKAFYVDGLYLRDGADYDWDIAKGKIEVRIFLAVVEGEQKIPVVFEGGSSSGCNVGGSIGGILAMLLPLGIVGAFKKYRR